MKKWIALLLLMALVACVTGQALCEETGKSVGKVDLDIASMNDVLTFATVNGIINTPKSYLDKRVSVKGYYSASKDHATGEMRRFMTVVDMMACCFTDGSIYLELVTEDPDAFTWPEAGQQFEVVGRIEKLNGGGIGCIRVETVTPLEHWQDEIWW